MSSERRSLTDVYFARGAEGNGTAALCTTAPPSDQDGDESVTKVNFRFSMASNTMCAVDYSSGTICGGEAEVNGRDIYIRLNGAVLPHAERDARDAKDEQVDTTGLCAVCIKWE